MRPDNQEKFLNNPVLVVDYVIAQPSLLKYKELYSTSRLGFLLLESNQKKRIYDKFHKRARY